MTTIAPPVPATIKFTGLSPKLTQILRAGTTLQQKVGTAKIGRTVATFEMTTDQLKLLLDHLVEHEITGSGASSPEVKRLRWMRREYGEALAGASVTVVHIITHEESDPVREQILDMLAVLWQNQSMYAADTLDDLARFDDMGGATLDHRRAWLAERL